MFKKWAEKIKQKYSRDKIFDALFLAGLCIIYSVVAFFNLGDNVAPQTFYTFSDNQYLLITLSKKVDSPRMMIYSGQTKNDFSILYSSIENSDSFGTAKSKSHISFSSKKVYGPFYWEEFDLSRPTSAILIKNDAHRKIDIGEIAVFKDGELIPIEVDVFDMPTNKRITENDEQRVSVGINKLTDESYAAQSKNTFTNSSYFDELYFAQTAYQYATGQEGYENVHPPLGKIIQSIPIALTGQMTPFTWRFMGTFAGILIIIATYFLAIEIFRKPSYGRVAAILVSLSGLHFVQTRIGTVDSYLCLFTVLSYLFMLKFYNSKGRFKYFLLSGLFFGCAFAVKWSGAFGGFGLALIFFAYLINTKGLCFNKGVIKGIFTKEVGKWLIKGISCFILIPCVIYFSSYLLFSKTTKAYNIDDVINQGVDLYNYHSTETTPHPYSSKWYTWPLTLKPMLYAYDTNTHSKIQLMGNNVISYVSVIGLLITLYYSFKKRDFINSVIITAWLSLWVPYIFVQRTMFLYHYLPASVFAILAVVNLFYQKPKMRKFLPLFLTVSLALFIIIYPVLAGI